MEKLDELISESIKLAGISVEIKGRLDAYKTLSDSWEKELKKMIKDDCYTEMIKIQEKHIYQIKAKIEVLTELKKAL